MIYGVRDMMEAFAAREERELRAAWRAGYDRVDVFEQLPDRGSGIGRLTVDREYHPRTDDDPRDVPDGCRYCFSYDLTSVPDDVVLEAIRGAKQ